MNDFEEIKKNTPVDIQIFIEKSFDIIDEIDFILEKKKINRSNLADKLDKSDSEISKWFSGLHNLTIKTISKIEATLGETIILTPSKYESEFKDELKKALKKIAVQENKIKKLEKEISIYKQYLTDINNYSSNESYTSSLKQKWGFNKKKEIFPSSNNHFSELFNDPIYEYQGNLDKRQLVILNQNKIEESI